MRYFSGALFTVLLLAAVPVHAAGTVVLAPNATRVVDFGQKVKTFYIRNPEVVDAKALDQSRVELMARAKGSTEVVAYDATGARVYQRVVRVGAYARRHGPARTSLIVQNGKTRTTYACSGTRCAARGGQP